MAVGALERRDELVSRRLDRGRDERVDLSGPSGAGRGEERGGDCKRAHDHPSRPRSASTAIRYRHAKVPSMGLARSFSVRMWAGSNAQLQQTTLLQLQRDDHTIREASSADGTWPCGVS